MIKKHRKKILALFLSVILLSISTNVFADIGDNIGGGAGGSGSGATDSRYTYAYSNPQGYRITLISKDGKTVRQPVDVVNAGNDESFAKQVKRHFGKTNKLDYLKGKPLHGQNTTYAYRVVPASNQQLPDFLAFDIQAIKSWFTASTNIEWLCQPDKLDFDYNLLVSSPDYKLLVEPLVYINIPLNNSDKVGSVHAMTATEGTLAARKDTQVSYNLAAIVRRQLPISMFLEFDDIAVGLSAYTGKTSWGENEYIPNDTAFDYLGMGIIYFSDMPPNPDPDDGDSEIPNPPPIPSKYAYDFICNSVKTDTSPIREENDFDTTATFSYQQKIDCKYCTTTCAQCGLTGRYSVLIQNGYFAHYSSCGIFYGHGCTCGGVYVPPVYETRLCHLCYVNCTHCDKGELWYKNSMKNEYTAPTKSTTVDIFVDGAQLDYKKGISGVLKYTKTIKMTADTPMEVTAILNAGEKIGNKPLVARINWSGKNSESNSKNNEARTNISVIPATNLQIEFLPANAPYRTGSEVITSFIVSNKDDIGALNIRPKHHLRADFTAISPNGNVIATQSFNDIVVPKSGTNLIYFKWLVPSDYNADEITLSCRLNPTKSVKETNYSDNVADGTNKVQKYLVQTPKDTIFENKPIGFHIPSFAKPIPTSPWTQSVISAVSYQRWEWKNSDYDKKSYSLSLDCDYEAYPDEKSPSRKQKDTKLWEMRSGYGVFLDITPQLNSNLPKAAFTKVQNGVAYLPEFQFLAARNQFRTLQVVANDNLQFRENENTIISNGENDYKRLHFTPLWYPDGEYQLKTYVFDCWSPVGMLSVKSDVNQLRIEGDMYDDWYLSHAEKQP